MSLFKTVVFGNEALKNPEYIIDSVVLGSYAGHMHKRGTENIFIGKNAGYSTIGNNNIFIGANSGYKCHGSGNIILGNISYNGVLSNYFLVGNDKCVPIAASLETGDVFIDNLIIKKNIQCDGSIFGFLGSNVLERHKTNIGNYTDNYRTITIGDNAGFLNVGASVIGIGAEATSMNNASYVIAFGDNAGKQNTGSSVIGIGNNSLEKNTGSSIIAIGDNAGKQNTGSNVIFIGNNLSADNIISDSLYIGDFITGTSNNLILHKNLEIKNWNITTSKINISDKFELTPSNINFENSQIFANKDKFVFTNPISIGKDFQRLYNSIVFYNEVSQIVEISDIYYGLDKEGFLLYTKEKEWKSLRSPCLRFITKSKDNFLLGCDKNNVFYRYDSYEWIVEKRIDKGMYYCKKLVGSYALGTLLINDMYDEKGTILFRENEEWKLLPASFEDEFDDIHEWNNNIYLGNTNGIFTIENRKTVQKTTQPITMFCSSNDELLGVFKNNIFSIKTENSIVWCSIKHSFTSDIKRVKWDFSKWLVHTNDGVFVSPLWKLIHEKCNFLSLKSLNYPSSDISIPSNIQLGKINISEKDGILLNNGLRSGKVYDTEFNPLPISTNKIEHINIFLDEDEKLCFDIKIKNTRKLFKVDNMF